MAIARGLPYLGCHFQVRWSPGDGPPEGSGFSEVVLPPFLVDAVPGSGDGAAAASAPALGAAAPGARMGATSAATVAAGGGGGGSAAPGTSGAASPALLVLRRGFLGSLDLYTWWNDTRLNLDKRERTLSVDLLDGERGKVVCTWEFTDARPVQLDYAPLQALGASVLIETLTLRYASMTMK